mgnify:CR=1 FL=1
MQVGVRSSAHRGLLSWYGILCIASAAQCCSPGGHAGLCSLVQLPRTQTRTLHNILPAHRPMRRGGIWRRPRARCARPLPPWWRVPRWLCAHALPQVRVPPPRLDACPRLPPHPPAGRPASTPLRATAYVLICAGALPPTRPTPADHAPSQPSPTPPPPRRLSPRGPPLALCGGGRGQPGHGAQCAGGAHARRRLRGHGRRPAPAAAHGAVGPGAGGRAGGHAVRAGGQRRCVCVCGRGRGGRGGDCEVLCWP